MKNGGILNAVYECNTGENETNSTNALNEVPIISTPLPHPQGKQKMTTHGELYHYIIHMYVVYIYIKV